MKKPLEMVCPAGTLTALKHAVDAGADTVYVGFADETNARNFPGLNFTREELEEGVAYAHAQNRHVYLAVNTYARAGDSDVWRAALKDADRIGVDAVILADVGLLAYCHAHYPRLRKHLSVQASASNANAINFYVEKFDVKRVVLPRVLTIEEIAALNKRISVETEIFVFGGLCVMAEGRCSLSSYATGKSPNVNGVCSPANCVKYEENDGELKSKLGEFTINQFQEGEPASYPVICKGRFLTQGEPMYVFEEPTSLNMIQNLSAIREAGVCALKIEGRQRGKAYIEKVIKQFKAALADDENANVSSLSSVSEGQQGTTGSYDEGWQ
jgi:O2-independent ubiquinone biosynthesis protein UbiU